MPGLEASPGTGIIMRVLKSSSPLQEQYTFLTVEPFIFSLFESNCRCHRLSQETLGVRLSRGVNTFTKQWIVQPAEATGRGRRKAFICLFFEALPSPGRPGTLCRPGYSLNAQRSSGVRLQSAEIKGA